MSKKSGFRYWLPVHLPGVQKQVDQHEELSCNRNDGFLLADFALMGPKPIMKRRASDLDGGPGGAAHHLSPAGGGSRPGSTTEQTAPERTDSRRAP